MAKHGLDLDWYVHRHRPEDEVFAWDHLSAGLYKDFLWQDWRDALKVGIAQAFASKGWKSPAFWKEDQRDTFTVVVVDMDGDGSEQTGWNILYLHVAAANRVAEGEWVEQDDRIGHPSCEGGAGLQKELGGVHRARLEGQ